MKLYNSIAAISIASYASLASSFSIHSSVPHSHGRRTIQTSSSSPISSTSITSKGTFKSIETQLYSTTKKEDEGEEWHPRDPASTTPQLLSSLWLQIAQGCKNLSKGVRFFVKIE